MSGGARVLPRRVTLRLEPGRSHVDLRPQPQTGSALLVVEVEHNALALAEHAEHRAGQGVRGEVELGQVRVTHDDPVLGPRVVRLDHALHRWLPRWLVAAVGSRHRIGPPDGRPKGW